jgi:phosphoglycolate phosphatase-like HAD superfamily hydrolase
MKTYIGMVSSDWSQCLSPSGPFDAFVFHYPEIELDLKHIFKCYTSNDITLGKAVDQVSRILPAQLTTHQMDNYMEARFEIYAGVDKLIQWCRKRQILFMINTTGFMGYFQRVLATSLLPPFTVLSAQSMLRYSKGPYDPERMVELFEIEDKATNTAAIARRYQISPEKIVIIGDSGGDGPHFEWGSRVGATLVGSMTKPSLSTYCQDKGVIIDHLFGHTYAESEKITLEKERSVNFLKLSDTIAQVMGI